MDIKNVTEIPEMQGVMKGGGGGANLSREALVAPLILLHGRNCCKILYFSFTLAFHFVHFEVSRQSYH